MSIGETNWVKDHNIVLVNRVSAAGIEPNSHKILAVWRIPQPTDIKKVKRTMGMV